MSKTPFEMSDQELRELIKKIAKPSFVYFMKKMQKEIFHRKYKEMPMNYVISIILQSLANSSGNIMQWLDEFYLKNTGKNPSTKLQMEYFRCLKEHFDTKNAPIEIVKK